MPERFGNWHTVYLRLNRWAKRGVLERVLGELQHDHVGSLTLETLSLARIHRSKLEGAGCWAAGEFGGVPAFAGRCRGRAGARSRRSARLGGAEGAGARVRGHAGASLGAGPAL